MKKILVFSMIMTFAFLFQALPCFNPTDFFAFEVVLNKTGIDYNLEILKQADNLIIDEGVLIYQSHFDNRVAVILDEVNSEIGNGSILKGLSVKLQIPTKKVIIDNTEDLVEAINIKKDNFDFRSAIKIELDWLRTNGIISGISDADISEILRIAKAGLAGWNSRIVFDRLWVSFAESSSSSFIDRAKNCGGFDPIMIPDGEIIITVTGVDIHNKLIIKWGAIKSQ